MKKSYLAQFLLTLFLGPLGLFYSSTAAALAFLILGVILAFGTFGIGLMLLLPLWFIVVVVGFATVNGYNSKVHLEQMRHEELLQAVRFTNQEPAEESVPEPPHENRLSREHQFYVWFVVAVSVVAVLCMIFK